MGHSPFEHAPAPVKLGALLAVPVHIQQLCASVTFDVTAGTAVADAELCYEVGPDPGNPIFDLRQDVRGAWLDGHALNLSSISARDLGEDTYSTVRVLDRWQESGSVHLLRLRYFLGRPLAEPGGAYPPALNWSPGGSVRWSFGMADLLAGRYLEAWFPSNLPFDQFPFTLRLKIVGTGVVHTVITNGHAESSNPNVWRISFPDWFTSMSPFIELRAQRALESVQLSTVLPGSRKSVRIELWKPAGGVEDLHTNGLRIANMLRAIDRQFGAFVGTRYVCFFNGAQGGMEYAQASTSTEGALAHELFHSWFARGMTPASGADGWWDEAFTTYRTSTPLWAEPFDFTEAPIELCSRRPFQRRTPPVAYTGGSRFFRGVASAIGTKRLDQLMRMLYLKRNKTPLGTSELEDFLIAHSGHVELVDAFHRFVYGFEDPVNRPNLCLGPATSSGGVCRGDTKGLNSPFVWVRRQADSGLHHQNFLLNSDGWVYTTVTNMGQEVCHHFVVVVASRPVGDAPSYPRHFLPGVAAMSGFELGPGESRIVSLRIDAAVWASHGSGPADSAGVQLAVSLHARNLHPEAVSWSQTGSLLARRLVQVQCARS